MTTPRPSLVVTGQIVVAALPDGLQTAEAIGIADGVVMIAGSAGDVRDAAAPGARQIDAGPFAIVPGLHDFHLHLVGMARARRIADLEDASDMDEVVARVAGAASTTSVGSWIRGDGWHAEVLAASQLDRLEAVLAGRPALLRSHDRHSAWASRGALTIAGVGPDATDPPGGRFERDARGRPNGLLRESAADLVGDQAERMVGEPLANALRETAAELLGLGITGVTDAGDPTTSNGHGAHAALGDSFANLAAAEQAVEGGLRVTLNCPPMVSTPPRSFGFTPAIRLRRWAGCALAGRSCSRTGRWARGRQRSSSPTPATKGATTGESYALVRRSSTT